MFEDYHIEKSQRFKITDTFEDNLNRVSSCPYSILVVYDFTCIVGIRKQIHQAIVKKWKESILPLDMLSVAISYERLGAKYRLDAIDYFVKFFDSPVLIPYLDDFYYSCEHVPLFYESDLLYTLGLLYEKEYLFNQALETYLKCISYSPRLSGAYVGIGNVLMKTDINKCVTYYEKLIKSGYEDYYGVNLQYKLNDAKEKASKGYIFKPRNKKIIN